MLAAKDSLWTFDSLTRSIDSMVKRRQYLQDDYHRRLRAAKIGIIREALRKNAGNRSRTAKALGLQRSSLVRLIRQLGISRRALARQGGGGGR